jgi:hypothetical protein
MEKLIRFDWAIKKLLRDKANFSVLEGFLSAVRAECRAPCCASGLKMRGSGCTARVHPEPRAGGF